jgi:glycosyltransferase involved in cell wall biosynthesis
MNILILKSVEAVPYNNGKYFAFPMVEQFPFYSQFGRITYCGPLKYVTKIMKEVDLSQITIAPLHKINTIATLLKYAKSNRRVIRHEVEKADVVVAHVPSSEGFYAEKIAKQLNKPCVLVVIACPWDGYWNHSWRGKLVAPLAYLSTKWGMRNARFAVYVTQKFLQQRYPTKGRSVGISDVLIQPPCEATLKARLEKIKRTSIDTQTEIKFATTAAVNVRYKAQYDVIKAIALLRDEYNIHYYLIGNGDTAYLESVAKQYHVLDRVHFVGPLAHERVFEFLKDVDVYIQPSKQEGLPRAVVEAMSLGLPALGSNIAGIPELLSDEFLFEKGNVSQIADRIRYILHQDVLEKAALENFNKAKEYTPNILAKRRLDFLQQCFSEGIIR